MYGTVRTVVLEDGGGDPAFYPIPGQVRSMCGFRSDSGGAFLGGLFEAMHDSGPGNGSGACLVRWAFRGRRSVGMNESLISDHL